MTRKIRIQLLAVVLIFMILVSGGRVHAETTTSAITTLSRQQDLTVNFTFDVKTVDVVFISPSGERKAKGDEGVEFAEGEKWATYRIHDAQAGTWQVEYDFGENSSIDYSVIKDDYGLWIQSFDLGAMTESDRIPVVFQADSEYVSGYNYEIFAVSGEEQGDDKKIGDGYANANEPCEVNLRLNDLSSGTYTLRLEIYGYDGDVELFDAATSKTFNYQNPNEPQAVEDFRMVIDQEHLTCTVDWSEYLQWYHRGYRLTAIQDGEVLITKEYDRDVHADEIYYTAGTKVLEIVLSARDDRIWSAEKRKTVTLGEEYLTKATGEVSSSAQILIQYSKKGEGELFVRINDEEGTYRVSGEGEIAFPAQDGWNTVYARMDSGDLISYVIDDQLYYDAIPPRITLFEKLDGKHFTTEEVTLIGKVEGAEVLLVNGEEVTIGEQGDFSHAFALSVGENVAELVARDVNGNEAKSVLTLYRGEAGSKTYVDHKAGKEPFWKRYLPLLLAAGASIVSIILALIFLKKKEKGKSRLIGNLIFWDVAVLVCEGVIAGLYLRQYFFGRSMEFFELAERSGAEAAQEMAKESSLFKALLIGGGVLAVSVLVTVICGVIRKKLANKKEAKVENPEA